MSLRHSELRQALADVRCAVRESVPLAPHTHVRIGGPAAFFLEPATDAAVVAVIPRCRELDVPLPVLGSVRPTDPLIYVNFP